jgi:hypothetical protein
VIGLLPSLVQFFAEQEHYTAGLANSVLFDSYLVDAPHNDIAGSVLVFFLFPEHGQA